MKKNPVPKALGDALGYRITRLSQLFRRRLIRALKDFKLTPEQWQIVSTLCLKDEPVSQTQLGQIVMKDRHSMSRMIQKMEESGWVLRSGDPDNDRIQIVSATAKARDEYMVVRRTLLDSFGPVFNGVPADTLRALSDACDQLIHMLED